MSNPPEIVHTAKRRVFCDGATDILAKGGSGGAALGHPRVWLQIDDRGYVECGYCDRRFVLDTDPRARGEKEIGAGDLPAPGDASVE